MTIHIMCFIRHSCNSYTLLLLFCILHLLFTMAGIAAARFTRRRCKQKVKGWHDTSQCRLFLGLRWHCRLSLKQQVSIITCCLRTYYASWNVFRNWYKYIFRWIPVKNVGLRVSLIFNSCQLTCILLFKCCLART